MTAIAAIHAARRQLGLDDDTARDLYARVTGKRSLREMSPAEQDRVVAELRRQGFTRASSGARKRLEGKYAAKLQALWIAAWNLGIVKNRDDKALIAFVERQTGLSHVRFLHHPGDAARAIEGLKGWMAREAGVEWTPMRGHAWLKHDAAKVALAQWRILHPGALIGICDTDFSEAVWAALGRPEWLKGETINALTIRDWQQVNKAWGAEVRRRRRS